MTDYHILTEQMKAFLEADTYFVPVLSNASALLWESMNEINWAGFYIIRDNQLVLGPFQGRTACIHIKYGKGVCGTAWEKDETLTVYDVHEFPGHIACDCASRSEIVVPIHRDGAVAAVLDIDSPVIGRFTEKDRAGLEEFAGVIEKYVEWR